MMFCTVARPTIYSDEKVKEHIESPCALTNERLTWSSSKSGMSNEVDLFASTGAETKHVGRSIDLVDIDGVKTAFSLYII